MMKSDTDDKVRAIIVDDESLARMYLGELLKPYPGIEIVAECPNGFDAVAAIEEMHPDLVFLDIQMPGLDGFEVLEALDAKTPRIIFVTAYDEYALRAFEVHAVDYLLKPFSEERLAMALERVLKGDTGNMPSGRQIAGTARGGESLSRIVVKEGTKVVLIRVDQVDYVAAEGDYVAIHAEGTCRLKLETIADMAAALDPARFVRIHRSTIINVARLQRITSPTKDAKTAILMDGTALRVSKSGYKQLKERLDL